MKNPIFNSNEGRVRSLARVLAQIALLFTLTPCIHIAIEKIIRSWFDGVTATAILGYDSSQFIVMFISIVWSVWLCTHFLDRRRFSEIGVVRETSAWFDYLFGFVLAFLLVATMLFIETSCGLARLKSISVGTFLTDHTFMLGITDGLVACLMIGFHEELLRFYQIKNLSEGLSGYKWLGKSGSIIAATILASLFFGVLHMGNNGVTPLAVLLLFLDGLFLSLIYITTGRGWLAFGFHAAWDFAEGNVFGFPVSGYPETYSLMRIEQIGNPIITGGSFGPDGGLINFVMIIFGTLFIVLWIRFREKHPKLKLDLCDWTRSEQ